MKVDVLTVSDVTIKKWRWWSDWIDVAVFDYACTPYLIQMKISRRNCKSFKSIDMTGSFLKQATTNEIGDLIQMSKS